MVQNKLLSTIQAYSLGFLTGNPMPWKRFCLFCLFHASLSIVDCSVQLVYTKFPNRVINRGPTHLALRGITSSPEDMGNGKFIVRAGVVWSGVGTLAVALG